MPFFSGLIRNDFCWDSGNGMVGWDIFCNNRTGSDNRIEADFNIFDNCCHRSNINVVSNDCRGHIIGPNIQKLGYINIVSDNCSGVDYNTNPMSDIKTKSYFCCIRDFTMPQKG